MINTTVKSQIMLWTLPSFQAMIRTVHDHVTYLLEYRQGKCTLKHAPRYFFLFLFFKFVGVVVEIELNFILRLLMNSSVQTPHFHYQVTTRQKDPNAGVINY